MLKRPVGDTDWPFFGKIRSLLPHGGGGRLIFAPTHQYVRGGLRTSGIIPLPVSNIIFLSRLRRAQKMETKYVVKTNGIVARRGNAQVIEFWSLDGAFRYIRSFVESVQIEDNCTIHEWEKTSPVGVLTRKRNGRIAEWGADDSWEFYTFLYSQLIGKGEGYIPNHESIGYILSTRENNWLGRNGSWFPLDCKNREKIYNSLPGALKRAQRDCAEGGKELIVISERFRSPEGSLIDRQITKVEKVADGVVDTTWSITGAFDGVEDACTKLQIREKEENGFESWVDYRMRNENFHIFDEDLIYF